MTKLSHIEPNVFAGFAQEMLEAVSREEPGSDEHDPSSPYRDSALNKALAYEQTRMNSSGAPPRQDYARATKLAGAARKVLGLLSQRNARRYQDMLADRFDGEDVIPGSRYLRKGGVEHSITRRGRRRAEE